jgi:hypothetical protein
MKICPSCRQTYTDDNLNFCLTDGSFLTSVAGGSEPKTVFMDEPRVTNQTSWGQSTTGYQPPAVWQNQPNLQQQQTNYPMRAQSQDQTLPVISLIVGILALLVGCFLGGIPLGVIAVILGVLALNNEKRDPAKYGGRGMAIAGIVTGIIGFLISIFIILAAMAG